MAAWFGTGEVRGDASMELAQGERPGADSARVGPTCAGVLSDECFMRFSFLMDR